MVLSKNIGLVVSLLVATFITSAASGETIYFVGGDPDDGAGGIVETQFPHDGFVKEHLEDLGHDVFYQDGNTATTNFATQFDLLVISATLGSGEVRGKFNAISTPILQWEEALLHVQAGNFPITVSGDDANNGTDARAREIVITNNEHYITEGFPLGAIEIAKLDAEQDIAMPWAANIVEEVTSLATHPELTDRQVLTVFEAGTEWADNTIAPMDMVNFPIQDHDFGNLNEIGLLLFNRSIDWLLGNTGGTGPVCDFDANMVCDVVDMDLLLDNLGSDDLTYDVNNDGSVTLGDRDEWLTLAGQENGADYVTGDTDFNGQVNSGDLNNLGLAWQSTDNPGWGNGDFNGDDIVNAPDLNEIGINWLHGVAAAAAVPEPATSALLMIALLGVLGLRRP